MPSLPLHQCSQPGCSALLSEGSRCPNHIRRHYSGKTVERGYDAVHERLRVQCFQRDDWRCRACGWEPEVVGLYRNLNMGDPPVATVMKELRSRFAAKDRHLHADHIKDIAVRPDLARDLDNYQTLCSVCHGRKTREEMA